MFYIGFDPTADSHRWSFLNRNGYGSYAACRSSAGALVGGTGMIGDQLQTDMRKLNTKGL